MLNIMIMFNVVNIIIIISIIIENILLILMSLTLLLLYIRWMCMFYIIYDFREHH